MGKIEQLLGKTLTEVSVNDDRDVIRFVTAEGDDFLMYHSQDCCESVSIEDINGDLESLIGNPILVAESSTDDTPKTHDIGDHSYTDESATWTFYKLATIKGHVDIRWYGSSNGYYSEAVSFRNQNDPNDSGYDWD